MMSCAFKRKLIVGMTCLVASSLTAEGRNEFSMRCQFDSEVDIVISEIGDQLVWQQGEDHGSVILDETYMSHRSIETMILAGNPFRFARIDMYLTGFSAGAPDIDFGTAILTQPAIAANDTLFSYTLHGHCEEILP